MLWKARKVVPISHIDNNSPKTVKSANKARLIIMAVADTLPDFFRLCERLVITVPIS